MPYHSLRDPEQLKGLLDAVLTIESGLELSGVLQRIVAAARQLTNARYGALGLLSERGRGLAEFVQDGLDEETVAAIGHPPRGEGVLGLLILDPRPLRLADVSAHPEAVGFPPGHPRMTSFLGVPLKVRDVVYGNLYLGDKQGASEFSPDDEALVVAFAAAAGLAVDRARLQARVNELTLAADRERIARDLHDTVIQRLFATGLSLQSSLSLTHDGELRQRIEEAVGDLDLTIRQVRTTIFALEQPQEPGQGLRARVLAVCTEAARSLGFEPTVRFAGAIDHRVSEDMAVELLSSLREALSNVARHAEARWAEVDVVVGDELVVVVADDGIGPGPVALDGERPPVEGGGQGIANMLSRARSLGGRCSVSARRGGGTEVRWSVPLEA